MEGSKCVMIRSSAGVSFWDPIRELRIHVSDSFITYSNTFDCLDVKCPNCIFHFIEKNDFEVLSYFSVNVCPIQNTCYKYPHNYMVYLDFIQAITVNDLYHMASFKRKWKPMEIGHFTSKSTANLNALSTYKMSLRAVYVSKSTHPNSNPRPHQSLNALLNSILVFWSSNIKSYPSWSLKY